MLNDQVTQHRVPMWMLDTANMQGFGIGTVKKTVLWIINKGHTAGHASTKILPHFTQHNDLATSHIFTGI